MFSQCKKYFTKHRGAIVVILIASLINAALGTVSPYITGSIVTRISNRYPPQAIFVGCCVLLANLFGIASHWFCCGSYPYQNRNLHGGRI